MLFDRFNKKEKRYVGPIVDIVEERIEPANVWNKNVRSIFYGVYLTDTNTKVGRCDLRIGMNDELYYAGNIGYRIEEMYRGNHYAYYTCLLLFEIAKKEYDMDELIITCSPDNIPSKKTLEKLKGVYIETIDVPHSHWLYRQGEPIKDIYHYVLE
ncbi:MAG: GNAT family N-acetyltransferase [Solobacterium sp.]|nr:GNAT family N-acetyltransferase [Solobacterium sp.]